MKKIVALLSVMFFVSMRADEQDKLSQLFGPNIQIPNFNVENGGTMGATVLQLTNVANSGQLSAAQELIIDNGLFNDGGVIAVGQNYLQGKWAIIGDMAFDVSGNIFKPHAIVRGTLAGSIPGAKLIDLDLKNLDFGATDISKSNFTGSDVTGAKFDQAKVWKADFSVAIGLTDEQKACLQKRGAIIKTQSQMTQAELDQQLLNKKLADAVEQKTPFADIKALVEAGADINATQEDGTSLLMFAVMHQDFDVADFLIQHGADVNAMDEHDKTALMLAAYFNFVDLLKLLLSHGALVNKKAENGITALMFAAFQNSVSVIEPLIDHGAIIDDSNEMGVTALHYAAKGGYEKIVEILIKRGAGLDIQTMNGTTPLLFASNAGYDVIVKMLLEAGADHSVKNNGGETAFDSALQSDKPAMLLVFEESDAARFKKSCGTHKQCKTEKLNDRFKDVILQRPSIELLNHYLALGADINAILKGHDVTPLMMATVNNNQGLVDYFIQHKADVNMKNSDGETALTIACWKGYSDLAEFLINSGADVTSANNQGLTGLHIIAHRKLPISLARLFIERARRLMVWLNMEKHHCLWLQLLDIQNCLQCS